MVLPTKPQRAYFTAAIHDLYANTEVLKLHGVNITGMSWRAPGHDITPKISRQLTRQTALGSTRFVSTGMSN